MKRYGLHLMKSVRWTWCRRKVPKGARLVARVGRTCRRCLAAIDAKRLRARKPIARQNAKRARERVKRQYGVQGGMAHRSPCYACTRGCSLEPEEQETQAAHVKRSRGARGTSADVTPLCARCHDFQHKHGAAALERKYDLPPGALAREADRLADLVTRTKRGERHGE